MQYQQITPATPSAQRTRGGRSASWRLVAVATLGLLFAFAAIAQQGDRRGERGQSRAGGQGPGIGLERLEKLLELDSSQVESLESIFVDNRADEQARRDARRSNRQMLQEALDSEQPNAVEIGELMIVSKQLREQGKAYREQLHEQVAEVLTAEQLATWEGFRRGRNADRRGPHRKGSRGGAHRPAA